MYYKIIDKLPDEMQVYKETPLDMEHPAYGVDRRKLRNPWERDYFTIENGNIKFVLNRQNERNRLRNNFSILPQTSKGVYCVC